MKVQTDVSLADILWYKIGGTAKYLLEISSKEDFLEAQKFLEEKNIENKLAIGFGSNLLFAKEYFDGAVLHTVPAKKIALVSEDTIEAFAGETLDEVIQFGFENNLIGLEWAGGLPGSVGAAVRGNVGAFGGEIKDVVAASNAVSYKENATSDVAIKLFNNRELEFGYRSSFIKLHKDFIVISATFKLKKASDEEVARAKIVYHEKIAYRESHHPLEYPNCGSVFKNVHGKEEVAKVLAVFPDIQEQVATKWHGKVSMAYLINRLGLSCFQIGKAQISPKHANFIVNLGGAKASDVLEIIKTIKRKFQKTFGFTPEVEVEIIS